MWFCFVFCIIISESVPKCNTDILFGFSFFLLDGGLSGSSCFFCFFILLPLQTSTLTVSDKDDLDCPLHLFHTVPSIQCSFRFFWFFFFFSVILFGSWDYLWKTMSTILSDCQCQHPYLSQYYVLLSFSWKFLWTNILAGFLWVHMLCFASWRFWYANSKKKWNFAC